MEAAATALGPPVGTAAVASAERRRARRRRFQLWLALLLGTFLLALLILAGLFAAYLDAVGQTARAHRLRLALEETLGELRDAETGQRGYLLTGDAEYLAPYRSGGAAALARVAEIERLTADDAGQQERLAELRPLVEARLEVIERSLRAADKGPEAALAVIREGTGKRVMDSIRALVGRMADEEAALLAGQEGRARHMVAGFATLGATFAAAMGGLLWTGLRRLEQDYDAERAEAEALARTLAEREDLLRQKDLLLREVNHRVKNSLQLASSLITLQAAYVAAPEVRRHLLEAQGRLNAIARVHQRLYTTEAHGSVMLADLLGELCAEVGRAGPSGAGARILFEAEGPAELPVGRAVPLALITNELVTNALKHAFPAGRDGTVTVALRTGPEDSLVLEVADDGVGLPAGLALEGGGVGTRVVTSLVRQLGAALEVEPGPPGVRFRVVVPPGEET